jgi:hypothetical protein
MATVILQVPLRDGSSEIVEIEVDQRDLSPAVTLVADDDSDRTAKATFTVSSALKRVLPALSEILLNLRSATHAPDEVQIELGLSMGGETGIIFTKGTAEATFKISATWHKPSLAGPPDPAAPRPAQSSGESTAG